jgi:DNA-binding PadR family transcriptional regulator
VSATRLLVLGVVRMRGQTHGYQVRRELQTWKADEWANAQPGSIYHALKQMAKEGLLEQVDADGEPGRTAYRLTPDGEIQFQVLLAKMLSTPDESNQDAYGLAAAVTFMTALPRASAISLLQHRLTELDGKHASVSSVLTHSADWGTPPHLKELFRLWCAQIDATALWARDLVKRLEAGEYVMADDAPNHFGCPGFKLD